MNIVILMGRLTADPTLKQTTSRTPVAQFTLAVTRPFANKQTGERETDFINCVAWKQTAEFISRYFNKGSMIAVEGRIQVRTYDDNNGQRHWVTEVIVDHAHFTGEKREQGGGGYQQPQGQQTQQSAEYPDFEDILSDGKLPF